MIRSVHFSSSHLTKMAAATITSRTKRRFLTETFLGDEFTDTNNNNVLWIFEKKMNSNKFKMEMFQYRKKSFMDTKSELVPCGYCGILICRKSLTRDHVRPRSHGFHLKDNCIMCCRFCNSRKADWNVEEWLKKESVLNPSYFYQICAHLSSINKNIT